MQTKLNRISEIAKKDSKCRFNNLIHLLNKENLKWCYFNLNRNSSAGTDSVSWQEYGSNLDENLEQLVERMKKWSYRPQPVKRIYIPKSNGKFRPLGIPALEDKIVQQGIARILTAIYENDFMDFSYGFRTGMNCHEAIKRLDYMIKWNPVNYVIDADIKGFFDNMSHDWMIKMLEVRIEDKHLLRLIKRFLKNGYLEKGKSHGVEKGTPQGSIMSPVLSNIYLHYVLDLWFSKVIKKQAEGFVCMVRYADDYIICVRYKNQAEEMIRLLRQRLGKFELELSEEKTKLVLFGRSAMAKARKQGRKPGTFDFLGFTHYNGKDRKGGFKVGRKTISKRFTVKLKELYLWLKSVRGRKPKIWWRTLCAKLRGHFQYYGISGNYRSIYQFHKEAIRALFKWLNRRSQRRSFNWNEFRKYLDRFPLPKPRIHHNLYVDLSYRGEG